MNRFEDVALIIFLVITALFSLLKKIAAWKRKRELIEKQRAEQSGSKPRSLENTPKGQVTPWDEIRRYLEGTQTPQAPPVPSETEPERDPGEPRRKRPVASLERRYLETAVEMEVQQFREQIQDDMDSAPREDISSLRAQLREEDSRREEDVSTIKTLSPARRLVGQLQGRSMKDAIVLSEILRPPLALRAEE